LCIRFIYYNATPVTHSLSLHDALPIYNHVTLRAAIRSRYQLFISTWAVSLPMMSASSVSVPMAARYTPTRNGLPLPIPHSHTATNGATAAPRMDETL